MPISKNLDSFETLVEIIALLRSPQGCPWDRKQTHQSLRKNLLEETYEVLEAMDLGGIRGFTVTNRSSQPDSG